jgi:hypothetical protein
MARSATATPVSYPLIHTNCVLTNKNLDQFPQLFVFLLIRHKQTVERDDPLHQDLFPHVIPVGGSSHAGIRPSAAEFRRFYQEVWAEVSRVWADHQDRLGVPQEKRGAHAIHRILPIGHVRQRGIHESIRAGIAGLEALPREEYCSGCAMATLYINQAAKPRLKKALRELLPGASAEPTPAAADNMVAYND